MNWDYRQARFTLILFLIIFASGQIKIYLNRPVYPDPDQVDHLWPPEGCILDATAIEHRALEVFEPGTTVGEAVARMGLVIDPLGSGRCLPPAGVLVRKNSGWSVRPMSQRQRWVWRIPMDLYLCKPEDLQRIRGIGPSLAGRIYRFVQDRGHIPSVCILREVPGIGPAKIKQLEKELEIP